MPEARKDQVRLPGRQPILTEIDFKLVDEEKVICSGKYRRWRMKKGSQKGMASIIFRDAYGNSHGRQPCQRNPNLQGLRIN